MHICATDSGCSSSLKLQNLPGSFRTLSVYVSRIRVYVRNLVLSSSLAPELAVILQTDWTTQVLSNNAKHSTKCKG
jgi:hypothetical protein